jgi:hypothetical protein
MSYAVIYVTQKEDENLWLKPHDEKCLGIFYIETDDINPILILHSVYWYRLGHACNDNPLIREKKMDSLES